jgi:hypothetical protein
MSILRTQSECPVNVPRRKARRAVTAIAIRTSASILAIVTMVATGSSVSAADEGSPAPIAASETARAKEFLELARREAAAYEIGTQDDDVRFEFEPKPVLQWSNPVIGEIYGGVFLWTSGGRPTAAAAIFKWYSPHTHRTHEFQSLSERKLTAVRDGSDVWTSPEPGVVLKVIPDAPVPSATSAGRLPQMRRLARGFRATVDHHTEGTHELRLLTQPLYRYAPEGDAEVDGALFAFVLGTDPEVLLLIESRRTAEGRQAWHYAPARMNFEPLRMTYGDLDVWTVPRLESRDIYRGRGPYVKFQFDDPQVVPQN